ncbi:hypothetical protein [Deinococcus cellulosilyticus]|uniref:Uncharacterized protein n=1 Tax=Deinococcus cellulosilyticus (strain DSM 18568 / NBRC 106333 / KACC 11606 / 5516J-15) TaxID=1223518 RepID=A0A511N4C9_DEIC1|nr:hypothetical protein [Deinococcus cellulosilyticus]GEM47733.1 hypothetical protein DC3_33680 [Deinococcus cellulosilyticus NBRC 106333 = KACC 11606]
MMTLVQQHNLRIAAQARDFILVVTRTGELKSLRIRDILDIRPTHEIGCSMVSHLFQTCDGPVEEKTLIQEGASAFWNRCLRLLDAVQRQDGDEINQHFAPRVH